MTQPAIWTRGFRPFSAGASVFAAVTMAMWLAVYHFGVQLSLDGLSIFQWHAHEMIYGYTMAVIAGFLLTAAWNWTGLRTASGAWLAVIFLLWVAARILWTQGTVHIRLAAAADLLFVVTLGVAVSRPVLKTRQKRQTIVLLLLFTLGAANAWFYLGAIGLAGSGVQQGIDFGFYLVLGLVLLMGRRVVPFFTQRGVGYPVEMRNSRRNDLATSILFPAFLLCEVAFPLSVAGALLAGALFVSNSIRIHGWHTLGVWSKPLLWGLFVSFLMINLGFLLRAATLFTVLPNYLPVHAFAVGGIGLITMSMMARVSLGHTGRDIYQQPGLMTVLLAGMVLTAIIRVFAPLVDPVHYQQWIVASGGLWIVSFTLFSILFIPMALKPRVDQS